MFNYTERVILQKLNSMLYKIDMSLGHYKLFNSCTVTRNTRTYVTPSKYPKDRFNIVVDLNDVEQYADECDISDLEAAKMLVTHEIMHVLFKHFKKEYREWDRTIFSLAADCEVNSYLDTAGSSIRASQFDLPDFLNVEVYYMLLKKQSDKQKEKEQQSLDSLSSEGNTESSQESSEKNTDAPTQANGGSKQNNESGENKSNESDESSEAMRKALEKSSCSPLADKYTDQEADEIEKIIESYNIGSGSIQRATRAISKLLERTFNVSNIKGLDELIKKLERKEKTMSITPHARKETYMKLNNRRKNGTIILPGKRMENDGVKKKFDTSLTIFMDMSGSTHKINETLLNVAYKFYKLGATIIYYDEAILDTIRPNEKFRLMMARGGTNIKRVLNAYLATGAKIERAYVITDGEDYFDALDQIVPKYNIYKIETGSIREIYNDKNPCINHYY